MAANAKPKRAILYARYSPRPKRRKKPGGAVIDPVSIEVQLDRARAWCRATDLEMLAEHEDREQSGASTERRPGLERAIRAACKHKAVLVVYSLSRLARNVRDAIEIAERLDKCKADLASVKERIDSTTPIGRFVYTLLAALGQLEREQTADRTSETMRWLQSQGRRVGRPSRCPWGFRPSESNPDTLVEDKAEQAALAEMRRLRAAGMSLRGICRELDRQRISRRGKTWDGAHGLVGSILERDENRV